MKLHFYCIILVTLWCSNVFPVNSTDDDDEVHDCTVAYLKQQRKLRSDFPDRGSSVEVDVDCNFIVYTLLDERRASVEQKIKEHFPNEGNCLIKEFGKEGTLDLIVKLSVIDGSTLSVSEKVSLSNETRNKLRQDLIYIALECGTNEKNFIGSFGSDLNVENITLSQFYYCLAKYVADSNRLPLKNVELNPDGIETANINCTAVVDKERREMEVHYHRKVEATTIVAAFNCVMETFKNYDVVHIAISSRVLNYAQLSMESKDEESRKIMKKLADIRTASSACTTSV